jgi:hypothetical protein
VKIYAAARVEALTKENERQGETQFTTEKLRSLHP